MDELTKLVCGPGGLMNALLQVNRKYSVFLLCKLFFELVK